MLQFWIVLQILLNFEIWNLDNYIKRVNMSLIDDKITELYPEYRQYQPVIHKVCDGFSILHDIDKK